MEIMKNFSAIVCLITTLMVLFISLIFAFGLNKINIKQIKNKYSDEEILQVLKPQFSVILLFSFVIGIFLGCYLIPFLSLDLKNKILVFLSLKSLLYCTLAAYFIYFIFCYLLHSIIMTDKRIISKNVFNRRLLIDCWEVPFDDIKNSFIYNTDKIIIETKDGKEYEINPHRSSDEFYLKLKDYTN